MAFLFLFQICNISKLHLNSYEKKEEERIKMVLAFHRVAKIPNDIQLPLKV